MTSSHVFGALTGTFVACCLLGCDAGAPASDAAGPQGAPAIEAPTRGKPGARPSVQERLVEKRVEWPDVSAIDAPTRARLAGDAEKVDLSGVPVLVPARGLEASGADVSGRFAKATLIARADWFSLALKDADFEAERAAVRAPGARGAGLSVFVQGHRTARRIADVPPTLGRDTLRGRPAWVTQNEGVWAATWDEYGVTYAVNLECGDPEDARCADDRVLREVVESLSFVGGDFGARRAPSRNGLQQGTQQGGGAK